MVLEKNKAITQAIADDIGIKLSINECKLSDTYTGDKNNQLQNVIDGAWRTNADTIERLRILSEDILLEKTIIPQNWTNTMDVLENIKTEIMPSIKISGKKEHAGIVTLLMENFYTQVLQEHPPGVKLKYFQLVKTSTLLICDRCQHAWLGILANAQPN